MANIFITPTGYSGTAELTASNGLEIVDQGRWGFSRQGYNDGATFGLSLGWPDKGYNGEYDYGGPGSKVEPLTGGNLKLSAENWSIANIGNELTEYYDPETDTTYPASQCRIQVTGGWQVIRQPNSNSYNSFGVSWTGTTKTDQGDREMGPYLLNFVSPRATYVIQGADVTGGAQDTFSNHIFYCHATETATSSNSNNEFQSNTIIRPVWVYAYSKSWEII
jgi:hypothetical protein